MATGGECILVLFKVEAFGVYWRLPGLGFRVQRV